MYSEGICSPALIYLLFSLAHIIIDISKGLFNSALVKFSISVVITTLLNYLCSSGLIVISWFIVFIPFILMTIVTTMLLFSLGLSPYTGSVKLVSPKENSRSDYDERQKIINEGI